MKTRVLTIFFATMLIFIPLLADAGTPLYYGSIQFCNAGVVTTNPAHLNCDTYTADYTTSVQSQYLANVMGSETTLYVGTVPYCNAAVVSTNPNHLNCATQFIGYPSENSWGSALYVGIGSRNAGVVSTNPNHLNDITKFIGYTSLTTIEVYTASGTPHLASWNITGPVHITDSGWFEIYNRAMNSDAYGGGSLPPGTYTITWGAIPGYTTPSAETKTLVNGEVFDFYGNYTLLPVPSGSIRSSVTVFVAPSLDFTGTNTSGVYSSNPLIAYGTSSNLSWNSTNADSCTAKINGINAGAIPTSYSPWNTGFLYSTTDYSITCVGSGGSITKLVTVSVPATVGPTCGPYSDVIVTGNTSGEAWGSSPYTDESASPTFLTSLGVAAVHSGVLSAGQAGIIRRTSAGMLSSFPGSTQNGVTTASWNLPWCAVTLSLVNLVQPLVPPIPSTLKACVNSCTTGSNVITDLAMSQNDTRSIVACYNTATACNAADNSGNVTLPSLWAESGTDIVSLSNQNIGGIDTKKFQSGTGHGTETVTITYPPDPTQSVVLNVAVPCIETVTCDSEQKKVCTENNVPSGRTLSGTCGTVDCSGLSGTRFCDFNWREVAP